MKNAFFTLSTELNKSKLDILSFKNTKQLEPIHTHHEQTAKWFLSIYVNIHINVAINIETNI